MSVSLSEHLPLLAEAPDGIKKLRGLILELAVRGKLVPQEPSDEPASKLLKRTAAEKTRLVAEGTIRQGKPLAAASKDEQPFAIPVQWQFVRLGEVLEMINGRAFKPTDWTTQGLPIVRIQNLNNVLAPFNYSDPKTVADRHLIHDDDLLISWSGTPGTSFGAFIWNRGPAVLNQHIFRCVQIGDAFWNQFLRLAINSQLKVLISKAQGGVGLQHVTKGTLEALPLPLPPVAEQHRIVAKVDELMALCDRMEAEQADAEAAQATLVQTLLGTLTQSRDAAELDANWQRLSEHFDSLFTTEASLDALKKTILQLAVMGKLVPQDPNDEPASELLKRIAAEKAKLVAEGKIRKDKPLAAVGEDEKLFELPERWEWSRLQTCFDVRDGTHDTPKYQHTGFPFVTSKNIYGGRLSLENVKFISEADHKQISERSRVDRGDILFAMIGSIGNPVVVDIDPDFSIKNVALFKYYDLQLSSPEYLRMYLETISDEMKTQSAGGVQSFVSLGFIRSFPFPLPPLVEQQRIVSKVDELMALCDSLKADLAESRARQARLATTLIESALQAA